jgi:hypothetical protein
MVTFRSAKAVTWQAAGATAGSAAQTAAAAISAGQVAAGGGCEKVDSGFRIETRPTVRMQDVMVSGLMG